MAKIGVPSIGGVKEAMIDYGLGAGGGIVYALSTALTGSGLIGGLVGAGIAGSVIKGTRGSTIATMLGFMTIVGGLGGGATAQTADAGVM